MVPEGLALLRLLLTLLCCDFCCCEHYWTFQNQVGWNKSKEQILMKVAFWFVFEAFWFWFSIPNWMQFSVGINGPVLSLHINALSHTFFLLEFSQETFLLPYYWQWLCWQIQSQNHGTLLIKPHTDASRLNHSFPMDFHSIFGLCYHNYLARTVQLLSGILKWLFLRKVKSETCLWSTLVEFDSFPMSWIKHGRVMGSKILRAKELIYCPKQKQTWMTVT